LQASSCRSPSLKKKEEEEEEEEQEKIQFEP
jgi:hypothetical protein